jgi:hypothetical protein
LVDERDHIGRHSNSVKSVNIHTGFLATIQTLVFYFMSFTEFKSKYEHVLNELAKIEISKNQESSRGNSYNDTEQQIKIIDEKDEIF